jgi:hypothetical protein
MRQYRRELVAFVLLFGVIAAAQTRLAHPLEAKSLRRSCSCTTCDGSKSCIYKKANACYLGEFSQCVTIGCSDPSKCGSDQ